MNNRMKKLTIAIDLDGVLADFNYRAKTLLGEDWKSLQSAVMWSELDKHPHVFNTLPVCKDANKLITHLMYHDLYILTAIPEPTGNLASITQDKKDWVARHISRHIPVVTVIGGKNKYKYIKSPQDILIDDFNRNIDIWNEHGGVGILHTSTDATLGELYIRGVI